MMLHENKDAFKALSHRSVSARISERIALKRLLPNVAAIRACRKQETLPAYFKGEIFGYAAKNLRFE